MALPARIEQISCLQIIIGPNTGVLRWGRDHDTQDGGLPGEFQVCDTSTRLVLFLPLSALDAAQLQLCPVTIEGCSGRPVTTQLPISH